MVFWDSVLTTLRVEDAYLALCRFNPWVYRFQRIREVN